MDRIAIAAPLNEQILVCFSFTNHRENKSHLIPKTLTRFYQITDFHFMLPVNGIVSKGVSGAFHHCGQLFLAARCGA